MNNNSTRASSLDALRGYAILNKSVLKSVSFGFQLPGECFPDGCIMLR